MTRLAKALRLPPREKRILVRAAFLLPAVALGLRFFRLARVRAVLTPRRRRAPYPGEAVSVSRVVRAVARGGPVRVGCLPEALVIWSMLGRAGVDTEIRLGVRKGTGGVDAHAWVELDGVPLNDSADVHERYAALAPVEP